jgi:branched-subunit amino acid transport protein
MTVWLTMIAAGLLTYATRLSFIMVLGRVQVPSIVRRGLRFVPAAVLSAIVFSEILLRERQLYLSLDNNRLVAGIIAALVAWRSRSILLTIAVGMAALWILQFFRNVS